MKPRGRVNLTPALRLSRGQKVLAAIALRAENDQLVKSACTQSSSRQLQGADASVRELKRSIEDDVFQFPLPSEASLRSLFALTTAEARIAQRLASGDSVEEVARSLSIKMTTARTQLAAIFAKTNTRRQASLVALLSRVAHLEELISI